MAVATMWTLPYMAQAMLAAAAAGECGRQAGALRVAQDPFFLFNPFNGWSVARR